MRCQKLLFVLIVGITLSNPSLAESTVSDDLARCLADSTTGKDRKDLARWIFAALASHPEVANIATVSPDNVEATIKTAGLKFNRLINENCKKEFIASVKTGDSAAIKSAFGALGQLAMQELMNDPSVAKTFSSFEKYIDIQNLKDELQK